MKNGWHKILGNDVYVEDGFIVRATKSDGQIRASVYRWSKSYNAWIIENRITLATFRSGVKRGTISVM